MHEFLPNSCLLGIHLTISTHSGPQVVYHYPPASEDYISSKQRRNTQDSTGIDDSESNGKIYAGNVRKKSSMGASFTGQSLFSNDQKLNDEDNMKTPSIRSGGTASIRKRRAHSIESGKAQNDLETESSLSEMDSSSSGLSDSELSTDYADESSDSSSSFEHEQIEETEDLSNELQLNHSSNWNSIAKSHTSGNSTNLEPDKILKGKGSQISASKLLDIFNKEGTSRRASAISKLSASKTFELSGDEPDEDQKSELDFSKLHEHGKVVFDKEYFSEDAFQDIHKIFGLDAEFVAEFCSPEREMCNTKYEFTVDTLCFLGLPVHVDQHGNWRKSKRKKHTTRSKRSSSTVTRLSKQPSGRSQNDGGDSGGNDMDSSHLKPGSHKLQGDNNDEINEDAYESKNENNENSKEDLGKNMNMFHVCFVMNPSLVEYNERVDDMFRYAVARLSMVLRYAQEKSQYVSKECSIIMRERERVLKHSKTYRALKGANLRGKYLYQCILSKSSLARALTQCVEKLQQNDIACLEIGEDNIMTLQIPIQNEFSVLPNFKVRPVLRGSFLTSVLNSRFLSTTPITREDSLDDYTVSDHEFNDLLKFALLLDEPSNIIKELEKFSYQDDIGNIVLTHIVKHIQPHIPLGSYQYLIDELFGDISDDLRDSFQKDMLRSCALHLLYRRHARLIIPVSSRNTYIISPLAPIRGYSKNDYDYQHASGLPLIYQNQTIFKERFPTLPSLPSFLHLLSNGKPKPYSNIIPSKEHKSIYLGALAWLLRYGYVTQLLTFICTRVDRQIKMAVDEDLEREGFRAKTHSIDRDHDAMDNVAKSSKDLQTMKKNRTFSNEEEEEMARFAYDDPDIGRDYTIILEPERATAIEKRWMFKCVQDQPADIQKLFGKMLKYFNGRTPMELVILKEGISRHDIRKLIAALDRYVIEFNHW